MSNLRLFKKPKDCKSVDEMLAEFKKLDPAPEYVLIIYEAPDGQLGSLDNGVTISKCVYFIEVFKHWLLTCFVKVD
jgi:hypothetical protein